MKKEKYESNEDMMEEMNELPERASEETYSYMERENMNNENIWRRRLT